MPFPDLMKALRTDSPAALVDLLNNWFWEIPLEYTPTEAEARTIRAIIESRADIDQCREALELCQEYLVP